MRDNIKALVSWLSERIHLEGLVLEVGSYQVKGQEGYADLRPYFRNRPYLGIDMRQGPGVDCIQDVHGLGIQSGSASLVLCLDTLEHVRDPIKAVGELKRILTTPGVLLISSVMDFPIHEHPADYWRFTPQAFLELLEGLDERLVLYQGSLLKPHTVIGIGAKGLQLDLPWPDEVGGEPLFMYTPEFSPPDETNSETNNRFKYHYKIDTSDPESSHSRVLRMVKPGSRVLEIGCATGYMTRYLTKELGCEVTTVEIDEVAASIARPFSHRIIVADIEALDVKEVFKPGYFDHIILADVLEHLKDPRDCLKRLNPYLKDDGSLLISIPNAAHGSLALELLDGRWDYRKTGLLDSTHLRFFTISTFLNLLEETGFWAVAIERVQVDPWTSEFKTQWSSYPREVTAYLEKVNPEFRTYQFVIRACKMNRYGEQELYRAQYEAIKSALHEVQERLSKIEEQYSAAKEQIKGLLSEKEGLLSEKEGLQKELEGTRKERDKVLNLYRKTEEELSRARFELSRIEQSLGWRLLYPYRRFIEIALPKDTRRRRLYELGTTAVAYGLKEGPSALFRKAIDYIKRRQGGKGAHRIIAPEMESSWYELDFPRVEEPEVSIIIPAFNKSIYTFNCIKSILQNQGEIPFEVIVVDDASRDDTREMMEGMNGVVYVRSEENKGFVVSCNLGAEKARGNYLVFLNNDTTVTEGWLDALVDTFKQFRDAGLVGAKLVYPDGRLQEAGGIVFSDASGMNFGKWDDPDLPEYNYVRQVDYCSGAAMAISKDLFFKVGGLDTRYSPAYYEDTDLAMEVRRLGYKVFYQPFSVVVHHEGVTAGTDTSQGVKRYQEVNRGKFFEKWKEVLKKEHLPPGAPLFLSRERVSEGRLLVIDHYVPTPDKDSGSLRLFSIIEILVESGWKVILWPDNLARSEPYVHKLQNMGVEVYYGPCSFEEEIKIIGPHLHGAILTRPHIAPSYLDTLKRESNAMIVYDTVDLHFVREERRAKVEGSKKILEEARRWKETELYLSRAADRVVVVTPEEKEILEREGINDKVVVIPNIHQVFEEGKAFEERRGLMFIGGFVHPPNIDAMLWFVGEIFPIIQNQLPGVHLKICGSNPPREIRRLSGDAIEVTGYVPDVSPFFQSNRVFVSPLRYGAGLKGKIGQSMGYGLPVVTTSIGAEGYKSIGEPPMLIADSPQEFAEEVVKLYTEKALWEKMARQGKEFIKRHFSKEAVRPAIKGLLDSMKGRS